MPASARCGVRKVRLARLLGLARSRRKAPPSRPCPPSCCAPRCRRRLAAAYVKYASLASLASLGLDEKRRLLGRVLQVAPALKPLRSVLTSLACEYASRSRRADALLHAVDAVAAPAILCLELGAEALALRAIDLAGLFGKNDVH